MISIRRRITGLLASLLILGIIIGLPAVLLAVGANPLSDGLPTFDAIRTALTSPDDGTLAVALLKIAAWASWAFLTLSILLEALAQLRGVHAPRLPGLRLPQNAARGLVATALMLFVTIPSVGVATAAPSAPSPAVVSTVQSALPSAPATAAQTPTAAPVQEATKPATVQHTVHRGETLWSIAADHLGDGHRFKEIVDLNRDVLGDRPGFIKAGWVLDLPAPPPATDSTVLVEEGDTLSQIALEQYGDADRYPEIFDASRTITQPGGATLTDPDVIDVGWTLNVPQETDAAPSPASQTPTLPLAAQTPTPPQTIPSAPNAATPAATPAPIATVDEAIASTTVDNLHEESPWIARTSYGVGALLAAGVIALLATRRRTQQRRRRPGQRMPMPTGAAALVEQELRATADALSIETVDSALRTLARNCAEANTPLPTVRAARLTATQFDLYLAEPTALPTPWIGTADDTVWTLDIDNTTDLPTIDTSNTPAPYPALVTIGHDEEDGHVLLDLEFLGTLGVTGHDTTATREILAALAIELANSTWADDLQVTIVGAFPDLEDTLQTGRIRYLPSVGRILEDLLRRADLDRQAMSSAHTPDLHHARVNALAPATWPPEIVLLAGEITDRQRTQLEQLVTDLPRVALATITSGLNVGEWGLDLTAGDGPEYALLTPIGLQLRPQRLPSAQYGHLLHIASLSDLEELDPDEAVPAVSLAEVQSVAPVDEPEVTVPDMPEVSLDQLERHSAGAAVSPTLQDEPPTTQPFHPSGAEAEELVDEVAAALTTPGDQAPTPASFPAPVQDDTARQTPAETILDPESPETPPAQVKPLHPAPRILILGSVDLLHAEGKVEPTKRARLLEYAAYLALTPGATHTAIDNAIWPDRRNEDNLNTRNTATSKLRRWVGTDPVSGEEYLPRLQAGEGYSFHGAVTTDAGDWERLLNHDPLNAPTDRLEEALTLVRGIPFEGTHRKRYAWAEPIRQQFTSEIVDASYELTRRRLMEGRWRAAEQAVVIGLRIEPAQENLWRLRILAAHESRNPAAEAEAIERLLTITDQLECDLEPETEQLLSALKKPGTGFDDLMDTAL